MYVHSAAKRAESIALIDSGATENFINLKYAKWLWLPIKQLPIAWPIFNVNGTKNRRGTLQFYTDLAVQTRMQCTTMQFFLTNLGKNKIILGYPWFMGFQPKIDWRWGWIDTSQLSIITWAPNAKWAIFVPRTHNVPKPIHQDQYYIGRVTVQQDNPTPEELVKIPEEYQHHRKVFSEQASQRLPAHTIWDHAIKLLPGAPHTLPGRLLPLTQEEIQEAYKFTVEHLKWGTIWPGKGPYCANFFFIKKKDGKLCPVQDYQPLNKWMKQDQNVSPLISQTIDRLSGCTLFTKFNVRWGYNNICIKKGDEWKAAFLTSEGLFEPTVMFFGLTNSPATFQRMMNTIF
jgi:hypothetical protein